MGKILKTTVHVTNPDTHESVRLVRGSEVPDWAEKVITNPDVYETGGSRERHPSNLGPSQAVAQDIGISEEARRRLAASQPTTFDPGEHRVPEVLEYAQAHPDDLDRLIEAEKAGQGRTTLIASLEKLAEQPPFDPGQASEQEVLDHVREHRDDLDRVLEAERVGQNREDLIKVLEVIQKTGS